MTLTSSIKAHDSYGQARQMGILQTNPVFDSNEKKTDQ